ncbi:hypothetical protein NMG60_11004756 [Bertholletia excelsa]
MNSKTVESDKVRGKRRSEDEQPQAEIKESRTITEIIQQNQNQNQKRRRGRPQTRFICKICAGRKHVDEIFRSEKCSHAFCSDCVTKHIRTKIEGKSLPITCPAFLCTATIDLDICRGKVSGEVAAKWEDLLCESAIPASEKFYCPFRDCSAMLVMDGEKGIKEAECPMCHRLFCAECHVAWHSEVTCEEFKRNERGREDLIMEELAKSKRWMRCPNCKYYVEKTQGCLHMTCRCGTQFCYACGATWSATHGGCQPR